METAVTPATLPPPPEAAMKQMHQRGQRTAVARMLRSLPAEEWEGWARHAFPQWGGILIAKAQRSTWGPHWWEVDLYGVTATGDTASAALESWIKASERIEGAMA